MMAMCLLLKTVRQRWGIPLMGNNNIFLPATNTNHHGKNHATNTRNHSYLMNGNGNNGNGRGSRDPVIESIIQRLKPLGSGPLCDADKGNRLTASTSDDPDLRAYVGIRLMCPSTMKLRNARTHTETPSDNKRGANMLGIARTVQLTRPNDFLAVLAALAEVHFGDVLVVNTSGSTRAVAGSLFTTEAARRGVRGIVVDGPIRDVEDLACPTYSTMVSPYAGTVQHPGEGVDVAPILCGGVTVTPGDIIFGDRDGVLVGSADSFATCLESAENVVAVEQHLMRGMKMGASLHNMTNFEVHIKKRKEGKESALEFNEDLHTAKFDYMDPVHVK